jgi:hypothetical protein
MQPLKPPRAIFKRRNGSDERIYIDLPAGNQFDGPGDIRPQTRRTPGAVTAELQPFAKEA